MKVVKVHIRRGDYSKGESQLTYPERYNAQEVDLNGIGPCSVNGTGAYSGHIGRGGAEEWCFVILEDALADEYAQDEAMEIVSVAAADADMEQWRLDNDEADEVVRDPDRINAIRAKQGAAIVLSAEDLRALDPDDPMPGINKRLRKVADIVAKSGRPLTPIEIA